MNQAENIDYKNLEVEFDERFLHLKKIYEDENYKVSEDEERFSLISREEYMDCKNELEQLFEEHLQEKQKIYDDIKESLGLTNDQ